RSRPPACSAAGPPPSPCASPAPASVCSHSPRCRARRPRSCRSSRRRDEVPDARRARRARPGTRVAGPGPRRRRRPGPDPRAAAVAVAVVVTTVTLDSPAAYASWTPVPDAVPEAEQELRTEQCGAGAAEIVDGPDGPVVQDSPVEPVLVDVRGDYTYVVMAGE